MKKIFQKWLPPFLMFVMALWFCAKLQAPPQKDFAFNEFGQLPVTFNGRVKPLDSLARNSLLEIREKQTLNTEPWKGWSEHPNIISATEWLANVMMNSSVADGWPVLNGGKGPSVTNAIPKQSVTPQSMEQSDEFTAKQLGVQWEFVRNPDYANFSLTKRQGWSPRCART